MKSFSYLFSLLILTNIKFEGNQEIFQDLKQWLQQTIQNPQENLIQLRDQLCAGFFLIFCSNFIDSFDYLEQVKNYLVPEYFEALKNELLELVPKRMKSRKKKEVMEI